MERPLTILTKIVLVGVGILGILSGLILMFFPALLSRLSVEIQQPFTAVFIGASCIAGVSGLVIARQNRWSLARVQFPAILVLSAAILLATLIHRAAMDWNQPLAGWWVIAHAGIFLAALVTFVHQERSYESPVFLEERLTVWASPFFISLAAISGIIGLLLFLVPQALIPVWPWSLTPLTARLVGAWWLASAALEGMLAVQVSWKTAWVGIFSIVLVSLLILFGMILHFTEFDGPSRSKFVFILYNFGVSFIAAFLWRFGHIKE
jgi:hypothetical protein